MVARKSMVPVAAAARPNIPQPRVVESSLVWIESGSRLFDLVLGGGYPLGRIINIVGDRSSGKTLLAVEAMANFVAAFGDARHVKYADAESAFDASYAAVLGMPAGIQTCPDGMETVEQFFEDVLAFLKGVPEGKPCMYVLDSLDALSDSAEMERDMDKGSYGAEKAKKLSQFFRRTVSLLQQRHCLLIIISQIREKIGVTFGETKTRSGGKALDFYASQIIWLAEVGKLKRTALSVERVIGIETRARTKKNKVGLPFRECELTIIFNYGLDDEMSMLNWIKSSKAESMLPEGQTCAGVKSAIDAARLARDRPRLVGIRDMLQAAVTDQWFKIEARLEPPMRKYGE